MKKGRRLLGKLIYLCTALALLPTAALAEDNPFADVGSSDWYSDSVQYVYDNGLMTGTGEATFDPDAITLRGMLVTVLYRMEGEPDVQTAGTFSDVDAGLYYSNAIEWAAANGIVTGYGNGLFGPDDPLVREQMATILYRYAQFKGYDVSVDEDADILSYKDAAEVSEYAIPAMQWACSSGLLQGWDGNLMPQGSAPRCQCATVLNRFCVNESFFENDTKYTVTFRLNYGESDLYQTETVTSGMPVSQPGSPSRSGYSFSGWYTQASGGNQFDFNTAITADLTLYAQWNIDEVVSPDYGVTISSDSSVLTVYESGLADGSHAGEDESYPTTASGNLAVTAPDGVGTIAVGGVTVFENGRLTGNALPTDEGTLAFTSYDPATGKLEFTYELTGNTTEHGQSGCDEEVSRELAVTATDTDGDEGHAAITVTIVDDAPGISVDPPAREVGSGTSVDGTWDYSSGADGPATLSVTIDGEAPPAESGQPVELPIAQDQPVTVTGDNGTLTVYADNGTGTYSYAAKAATGGGRDSFAFRITDADGDAQEATLGVSVSNSAVDVTSKTLTVYESGLADGSTPGQADCPTTASGSLAVAAPDGVDSIVIGGKEVVVSGALTNISIDRNIPTDEGVLTVTAFDAATGELKFTYTLNDNTTEHGHKAEWDKEVSHNLAVTVTDKDGSEGNSTITVTIVDDEELGIRVETPEATVNSGESVTGNWTYYSRSADTPATLSVTISDKVQTIAEDSSVDVAGTYGTLTVYATNGTGTYSYVASSHMGDGTDSFTFRIEDADGDSQEATLSVSVVNSNILTVFESGLPGGSHATDSGHPTTAFGSMAVTAHADVETIAIGDNEVFVSDALTENCEVLIDEGVFTLQVLIVRREF